MDRGGEKRGKHIWKRVPCTIPPPYFCDTFLAPRCAIFFLSLFSLCLFIFLTRFRFVLSKRTAPDDPAPAPPPTPPHPSPAPNDDPPDGGRPATADRDDGGQKAAADDGSNDDGAEAETRPANGGGGDERGWGREWGREL
jgi:hypothetical protein